MAVGAGFVRLARLASPQRFAVEHGERRRVRRVVVLHRPAGGAELVVAGAALVERDFGKRERHPENGYDRADRDAVRGVRKSHSTTIFASSVASKPLSPIQWNASVPLSVATVWNVTNGFAAIAG